MKISKEGQIDAKGRSPQRALSRLIAAISPSVADGQGMVKSHDCGHVVAPKRDFKLSRPVLSNGDNIPLTPAAPRNCTRQSATEPLPLGVTSSVPVQREAGIPATSS